MLSLLCTACEPLSIGPPQPQELFDELTALDIGRQEAADDAAAGAASTNRAERPVIDPTPLRDAINALPGQEFKTGEE